MHDIRKLTADLLYLGCSDRRLKFFESAYPIPKGISYNSYLLKDDKIVLFDTVDKICSAQFLSNLEAGLSGRKIDYLVISHMEPDHCSLIKDVIARYPNLKIVCTHKTVALIKQFFDLDVEAFVITIKDGDCINTGKHELVFYSAPMVHWPEVMVTYDKTEKALFSADAFGSFGAIDGKIFDNALNFKYEYADEARRYYSNIVGKYGTQVQMLLKKISSLDIQAIYPLHGLVIKDNVKEFVNKYNSWSSYEAENKGVLIVYTSVYGNTENAINILSGMLSDKGVSELKIYDASYTHPSYIMSDMFKYSHVIIATTTYNNGIFESMDAFLHQVLAHNVQNRKFIIMQNGSWAPACGGQAKSILEKLNNIEIIDDSFCIKSALKKEQLDELECLSDKIVKSLNS